MASKEKRGPPGPARGLGPPPSPPEAGAPAAVGPESSAPPAQPPLTLAQPVSPGDPGFRLLLEENAFQALTQEPRLKRPRTSQDALSVGEGSLLCLPFPKKLWAIVNSTQFASIWWAKDGTCIGINEKLFQKEVLEREGPDKVFETDCMKSFVRQLNLYGFSKLRRDVHTSICLTSFLTGGAPVHVLSKVTGAEPPGSGVLGSGWGVGAPGAASWASGARVSLWAVGSATETHCGESAQDGAKGVRGAFFKDPRDGRAADPGGHSVLGGWALGTGKRVDAQSSPHEGERVVSFFPFLSSATLPSASPPPPPGFPHFSRFVSFVWVCL